MKRHVIKWGSLLAVVIIALSIFPSTVYSAEDRTTEIENLLGLFNSKSSIQRIKAAKLITQSGISDRRLFDPINQYLLDNYKPEATGAAEVDELAWLCKALASSGKNEYLPTLKKIADTTKSNKLERYATQSITLINEYAERIRIMSDDKYASKGYYAETSRLINMLQSENVFLKKNAAKKIYRATTVENVLYEIIEEELLKGFSTKRKDSDLLAWLCKALGTSGDQKYIATLEKVIRESTNSRLKIYAKQSLDMLK